MFVVSVVLILNGFGPGEKTAIYGINNGLGGDLSPAEKSAVKAFNGILTALDSVEFQVDVALRVWIYGDVNDMAIFILAFGADVVF